MMINVNLLSENMLIKEIYLAKRRRKLKTEKSHLKNSSWKWKSKNQLENVFVTLQGLLSGQDISASGIL